jgi:hypothetical protein
LARIYTSISEVYFATDQTVLAFLTLKRQNVIQDSLFNEESSRKLAQLEALYELDKIEKQNALLQKENENKSLQNKNVRLITFVFIFVPLSVLVVAGLIYLRFKQNQKATEVLEKQNLEISEQKQKCHGQYLLCKEYSGCNSEYESGDQKLTQFLHLS